MKTLRYALLAAALLAPGVASAQTVQQSGTVTPGQAARWITSGVVGTGGTAADGLLTALGITNNGLASFCIGSARASAAGRNQLCFGARTDGAAEISLQNYGTAAAQDLVFNLNGVPLVLPSGGGTFLTGTGTFTVGHAICVNAANGIMQDCGVSIAAGTAFGIPYYSSTSALTSLPAATNGQMIVGGTAAAPAWRTLSGDVLSVTAPGAVTIGSVRGVTYPSSYLANGLLYASDATTVASVVSNNIGYCLLSQGTGAAPIFGACASGSGSAGGSDTQVQFNSSSSLAGSANMTWASPALRLGVSGTTTGQLQLNSAAGGSGAVTLQAPGVTGAYNFNFPTGAGSLGQPLISGGGGSTPNTFGTLGIVGGGTNCAVASGTCLDNITGFASTGYINRTGAGTYAFAAQIPVSQGGTGLASGTSGGILGFTASGTLASSAELVVNGVVIGGGAGATPTTLAACTDGQLIVGDTSAAPACRTMSGDISTITDAGAVTIANSAVTNAKLANSAAYTLKGNFTALSAAPQDSTIGALTQLASPAANDLVLVQDQGASGQLKYATVSSIASAGSVSSIAGNTGAFTLTQPITNATNAILLNATITPQGRVTLTSGTPVMTSTASAQATVYYTPYVGNLVPIYDGTNVIPTAFAEVSQATSDATKSPAAAANNSGYDIFCWVDSGTNRCTRGPAWSTSTTRGTGAGTTELVRVRGLWLNAVNITNGPAAQRGTYVGSIRTNGTATVDWIFGGSSASGTAAIFNVYNAYNRVQVGTRITATGAESYTSATIRQWGGAANMQVTFLDGLAEDASNASVMAQLLTAAAGGASATIGVGVDSTTAYYSARGRAYSPTANQNVNTPAPPAQISPLLGAHVVSFNMAGDGVNSTSFNNGGDAILIFNHRM